MTTKLTVLKDGKTLEFTPTPDMTAYDLAIVIGYLYAHNSVGSNYIKCMDNPTFLDKYFKEKQC